MCLVQFSTAFASNSGQDKVMPGGEKERVYWAEVTLEDPGMADTFVAMLEGAPDLRIRYYNGARLMDAVTMVVAGVPSASQTDVLDVLDELTVMVVVDVPGDVQAYGHTGISAALLSISLRLEAGGAPSFAPLSYKCTAPGVYSDLQLRDGVEPVLKRVKVVQENETHWAKVRAVLLRIPLNFVPRLENVGVMAEYETQPLAAGARLDLWAPMAEGGFRRVSPRVFINFPKSLPQPCQWCFGRSPACPQHGKPRDQALRCSSYGLQQCCLLVPVSLTGERHDCETERYLVSKGYCPPPNPVCVALTPSDEPVQGSLHAHLLGFRGLRPQREEEPRAERPSFNVDYAAGGKEHFESAKASGTSARRGGRRKRGGGAVAKANSPAPKAPRATESESATPASNPGPSAAGGEPVRQTRSKQGDPPKEKGVSKKKAIYTPGYAHIWVAFTNHLR
jgi:hypothetical protein